MGSAFYTKKDLRCSRCGSEEVVIFRRYSGEAFCRKCLRESLLNRIRRSISRYKLLRRDDEIIFLRAGIKRDDILWDLFSEIESGFPTSVAEERIGSSSDLWDGIMEHLKRGHESERKVVVPLILDDVVGLLLRFIFTGSPRLLVIRGRVLLALKVIPNYVSPFVEIPMEELSALEEGENEELSFLQSSNPYLKLVGKLEEENPGMRFNILRMIERDDLLRSMGIVFR